MFRPYLPTNLPTAIITGGPAMTVAAIFWAHVENIFKRPGAYAEAPPTISRTLIDPAIADPFAVMMFIAAGFLAAGIFLIAARLARLLRRNQDLPPVLWLLFAIAIAFEAMGVIGMIVLSQYTGDISADIHELGSYMLFAGHAVGIALLGFVIAGLLKRGETSPSGDRRDLALLEGHPAHAIWVAVLSIVFLVIYQTRPLVPHDYFFVQRTLMSSTEMVILIMFVAFLQRFAPLFRQDRQAGG
jgi:hypothetical protein